MAQDGSGEVAPAGNRLPSASVDDGYVPVRADSVSMLEIEGEAILVDEATRQLHVLNSSGTLLWSLLDGSSSIGEICADISDVVGVPLETIISDAISIIQRLDDMSLVHDGRTGPVRVRGDRPPDAALTSAVVDGDQERTPAAFEGTAFAARIGTRTVRVVCTSPDVGDLMRAAFDEHLLEDGIDPMADTEVLLHVGSAPGSLVAVHYVYIDGVRVLRSANLGRMIRAVLGFVSTPPPPNGVFVLFGRLFVGRRGAIIARTAHEAQWELPDRGLARRGWRQADLVPGVVDLETFEVVPPPPAVELAIGARAEIDSRYPIGREELADAVVRTPLVGLVAIGYSPEDPEQPDSTARRLGRLAPFVIGPLGLEIADFERLQRVVECIPSYWLLGDDPGDVTSLFAQIDRRRAPHGPKGSG